MASRHQLAELSSLACEAQPNVSVGPLSLIASNRDLSTGFAANAHFNSSNGQLVVSYAGTGDFWPDMENNAQLGSGAIPVQAHQGVSFAQSVIGALQSEGLHISQITYTGHSLGGYIAQHALVTNGSGNAMVFNAPGYGGWFCQVPGRADVTYVFIPTDFGVNLANNTVSVVNRLIMAEIFGSIEPGSGFGGEFVEGLPVYADNDNQPGRQRRCA